MRAATMARSTKKAKVVKMYPKAEGFKKTLKEAAESSAMRSKILFHNIIFTAIFLIAMMFVALFATEIAITFTEMMIGYQGVIMTRTIGELIAVCVIVIMSCGTSLFFTIKLENWLIKSLVKRIWHYKDGQIVKGPIVEKKIEE